MRKIISTILTLTILTLTICIPCSVSAQTEMNNEETRETLSVNLVMASGASIRLNNKNGIRFYTNVDENKIAQLKNQGATVEMGTLIAPKDLLDNNDLTFDLSPEKYLDVKYTANSYYTEDDFRGIVGSIVNIKESNTSYDKVSGNITREFVGRGYAKVTWKGREVISYATYANNDIVNNSRSLAYVSKMLQSDLKVYEELDINKRNLIDKWAKFYK